MLNTLFIGCAGAGSNVVEELKNKIEYNFVKYLTIDTSDANVKKDIPFRHIKKDTSDGSALAGSGGIRGKNYNDVQKGCIDFINDEKLHTFDGVIYLVFSSNGGSGNVIASVILIELLTKNIPVACLIVHDTTSKQYALEAKACIESIYNIAVNSNKAIPVNYYFNNTIGVEKTNSIIIEEVKSILAYNDIENIVDIDAEDMKNMYHPTNYTKLNIPAGIYGISALSIGDLKEINNKFDVVIGRCLTSKTENPFSEISISQYKKGTNNLTNDETMLLLVNNFSTHYELLEKNVNSYNNNITMHKIETKANDDGMVF